MISGMMTLSGTSVATSSSVPPGGAALESVNVSDWRSPVRSVSSVGETARLLASMRKVPTGELPEPLLSTT